MKKLVNTRLSRTCPPFFSDFFSFFLIYCILKKTIVRVIDIHLSIEYTS
jgi:hypothetical protein